jgi:hypothetical protein
MTSQPDCPVTRLTHQLLVPMILGVLIIGAFFLVLGSLFGAFGALLLYFGANRTMDVAFFGQGYEITNLGIFSLLMAGTIVVVTLERVLKSIDEFNNREGVNFLQR